MRENRNENGASVKSVVHTHTYKCINIFTFFFQKFKKPENSNTRDHQLMIKVATKQKTKKWVLIEFIYIVIAIYCPVSPYSRLYSIIQAFYRPFSSTICECLHIHVSIYIYTHTHTYIYIYTHTEFGKQWEKYTFRVLMPNRWVRDLRCLRARIFEQFVWKSWRSSNRVEWVDLD